MDKKLENIQLNMAILIHTFPLYSLTFIADEIDELRRQGCLINIFSIRRPTAVEYPDAYIQFKNETCYLFPVNKLLFCYRHVAVFLQHPLGYLKALFYVLSRRNLGISGKLKLFIYFAEAVYLYPLLKKSKCNHLHVHFMFGGAAIALILHKLCGFTYSMTAHGTDFLVKNQMLKEKMMHASFVRVGTHFNAQFLQAILGDNYSQKIFVLPFGIDMDIIPKIKKQKTNAPLKIINIGRLVWQKGQLLLIEAIYNLRQIGYGFTVDIIGEGEMRSELEREILAKGLSDVVKLHGALPRNKVMESLADSDIFVFSSVSEGFGIVLLEAMLSGVAIVAPRLNGIPEIIEDEKTGKLFQVGSVSDLTLKIEELLINPAKRDAIVQNASIAVHERFNQREKIAALFKKIHENYN
ncbi:MAG: glycosyltransferase [Methylobacter sp.]